METQFFNLEDICRFCAEKSDRLIGIYSEEGEKNDLPNKINLYLPEKVTQTNEYPLQCCLNCMSIITTWHDFVLITQETSKKLKFLLSSKDTESKIANDENNYDDESKERSCDLMDTQDPLDAFCEESISSPKVDCQNKNLNDNIVNEPQLNNVNYMEPELNSNKIEDDYEVELKNFINLKEINSSGINLDDKFEDCEYHYECDLCPTVCNTGDEIITHMTKMHPEEMNSQDINENSIKRALKNSKRKHTKLDLKVVNDAKVVVDGRVYYNCKECGKSLHSPYTYVWHMRIHTGERPFVCDLCGKRFRVSQGLVRHLRETHEGIKNFPCDLCGRMFSTKRNVEEHRRIHTNERPYVCDSCGKAFKQKASLFVHSRVHNNSFPFQCSYCHQSFRTKPPLLIHVTRHTGEKPYACDVCGRRFRIKYELKRHTLIHSEEKPFTCKLCGLCFRQKRYLRNHHKGNHSNVPFSA